MSDDPLEDALRDLERLHDEINKTATRELGSLVMSLAEHIEQLNEAMGALITGLLDSDDERAEAARKLLADSHNVVTWTREAGKAALDLTQWSRE